MNQIDCTGKILDMHVGEKHMFGSFKLIYTAVNENGDNEIRCITISKKLADQLIEDGIGTEG